ncbi:hypothetical protein ACQP1O_19550 [Nocardia sp. CA-151230]|uniref:hypothetical protein n=1 Tax=Nocardia sp. CA-151230 TaxID=3239982 RepID=UPI003D8A58DA
MISGAKAELERAIQDQRFGYAVNVLHGQQGRVLLATPIRLEQRAEDDFSAHGGKRALAYRMNRRYAK